MKAQGVSSLRLPEELSILLKEFSENSLRSTDDQKWWKIRVNAHKTSAKCFLFDEEKL